jgi:hypothetical protein
MLSSVSRTSAIVSGGGASGRVDNGLGFGDLLLCLARTFRDQRRVDAGLERIEVTLDPPAGVGHLAPGGIDGGVPAAVLLVCGHDLSGDLVETEQPAEQTRPGEPTAARPRRLPDPSPGRLT